MDDYDIQEKLNQLKKAVYARIEHAFLVKTIDFPALDDEKMLMLYRMLRESHCPPAKIETYVVTIMLVQAALDIHDSVNVGAAKNDESQRFRQLTVLAGDYYSGLYYFLLSEIGDYALIREIARSIQSINEHKMHLYKNNSQTVEETFEHLRVVEASLLQSMADYFDMPLWGTFFGEYFLLRRLLAERHQYLQSRSSFVVDALADVRRKKTPFASQQEKIQQFLQLLDSYIDLVRQSVERLFVKHSRFEKMLGQRIWKIFLDSGYSKQELAEEG